MARLHFNGLRATLAAVDPASTARQIGSLLSRHSVRMGQTPTYGT